MFRIQTLSDRQTTAKIYKLASAGNGRYRQSPYNPQSPEVIDYYAQFARLNSSINAIPEPYKSWVMSYRQYKAPGGFDWTNNIELFGNDPAGWQTFLRIMDTIPQLVNPNFDPIAAALLHAAHADAPDKRAFTLTFVRDHYINAVIIYYFCRHNGTLSNTAENTLKLAKARQEAKANFDRWYSAWHDATDPKDFMKVSGKWLGLAVGLVSAIVTGGATIPVLAGFLATNQDKILELAGATDTKIPAYNPAVGGNVDGGFNFQNTQSAAISPVMMFLLFGGALLLFKGK